jgi:DNA-binding transcriptional LysR family regulator
MTTLDVRRMRVLREVAARGTIAAAARALAYTPSAVSQQLSALERETGVELLDRSRGRVRLTDAGRTLVDHTEVVLAHLEAAAAALAAGAPEVRGPLRVAAFPSASATLLPAALADVLARHPRLEVATTELEPHDSLPALALGDVDAAIAHESTFVPAELGPALEARELLVDPLRAVLPAGHPAVGEHVALAELADEPWVAPARGTACRALLEHACHEAGFAAQIRFEANDFRVMTAFVERGLGAALIPELGIPPATPGVEIRPLTDARVARRIFFAVRAGSAARPSLAALAEALAEASASR